MLKTGTCIDMHVTQTKYGSTKNVHWIEKLLNFVSRALSIFKQTHATCSLDMMYSEGDNITSVVFLPKLSNHKSNHEETSEKSQTERHPPK